MREWTGNGKRTVCGVFVLGLRKSLEYAVWTTLSVRILYVRIGIDRTEEPVSRSIMPIQIIVVPYNPHWPKMFLQERDAIADALDTSAIAIHHIGSTSIPGMMAKPLIDIVLEVPDLDSLDAETCAMEQLGYAAMGEFGIPGRRFFRKENDRAVRTHHVHAFATGDEQIVRHLRFRDFMIAHPEWAKRYAKLKQQVAAANDEIEGYMEGKDAFIKRADEVALAWELTGRAKPAPAPAE